MINDSFNDLVSVENRINARINGIIADSNKIVSSFEELEETVRVLSNKINNLNDQLITLRLEDQRQVDAQINSIHNILSNHSELIYKLNDRVKANDTDIASLRFDVDRLINIVSNLKDELIPIRIRAERIENKTDLLRSEIDLLQEVDNHIGKVGKIRKLWRWLW